jgi:hypothetical protein
MSPRAFPVLLAAFVAALFPASVGAEDKNPRPDIEAMEALLDQAVAKVSRPSVHVVLGGREAARGYRLKGMGAVFVLPPRALPGPERDRVVVLRDRGRPGLWVSRMTAEQERELQAIQGQIDSLQHEAERAQRDAERAFEVLERNVRVHALQRVGTAPPAPAEAPAPSAPPRPPAPDVVPPGVAPPPPWRFWFPTERGDERTPERVVADVKGAVVSALETHGGRLLALSPDEWVLVAVDFVPPRGFDFDPSPAGEQSLVIRVKKRDLVEAANGKITPEELRRRIDYTQY